MIIQITMLRDELPLLKELLPIWKKYIDGFVFLNDNSTDGSYEYLLENKNKYNILEILSTPLRSDNTLQIETNDRQTLFNAALKYGNHIICLDADEYLDGSMSKQELESLLNVNKNTVFYLKWIQYTSCNTIRVDGPWKNNWKDRIGSYESECLFNKTYMHSTHLPIPENNKTINPENLFISHLQWLNKDHVAIKQYYWKTYDWVTHNNHKINVVNKSAYDESVADFNWEEEYFDFPLKIKDNIFDYIDQSNSYKLKYILEKSKQYNIPNLGDWNTNLLNYKFISPKSQYKISIITAIGELNIYEKFIDRYLENVLNQHFFKETEHIIVYSDWTDKFNEFLKYKNFKLIKEDKKLGVYNAWNIGIQNSSTKYITNWNIDDLRHPINTKIKYDLLEKNNQYDIVYNYYISTQNINENFYNTDLSTKQYLQFPDEFEKYCMENCLIGPDPMWRKSLHDKVGYFDYENFKSIGDWEMWIRFAKNGSKFKLIPEILCIYFNHENTVSNTEFKNKSDIEQKKKLYEKYNNRNNNI